MNTHPAPEENISRATPPTQNGDRKTNTIISEIQKLQSDLPRKRTHVKSIVHRKQYLVSPLIRALGYDTGDPDVVESGQGLRKGGGVHYCIREHGERVLLIDCVDINQQISLLEGPNWSWVKRECPQVPYAVTDGTAWHIYLPQSLSAGGAKRKAVKIHLLEDDSAVITEKFLGCMMRPQDREQAYMEALRSWFRKQQEFPSESFTEYLWTEIIGRNSDQDMEGFRIVLGDVLQQFLHFPEDQGDPETPQPFKPQEQLPLLSGLSADTAPSSTSEKKTKSADGEWIALSDFDPKQYKETPSGAVQRSYVPASSLLFRLWEGESISVATWEELLIKIIEALNERYREDFVSGLPYLPPGASVPLIQQEKNHTWKRVAKTDIYVRNIGLNTEITIRHCRELLENFEKDPDTAVQLKRKKKRRAAAR